MKRIWGRIKTWLRCTVLGHWWKETDVFHVEYGASGYSTAEYWVVSCVRCGKRREEPHARITDDRGNHG